MKDRKIYLRRKGIGLIVEGKRNNKTIFLFTIPNVLKLLKSSLFTEEKKAKIMEKIQSLDIRKPKVRKTSPEVRTLTIVGTSEIDDFEEEEDEDYEDDNEEEYS